MPDVHEQIGTLEERFRRFRLEGSPDVIIEGDIFHGYAVNVPQCPAPEEGSPVITGACCLPDGTCEEVTVSQCLIDGGTFVGGLCVDADCQPTGACCVGSDCTIETESDCTDMGGTYRGDDTTCDDVVCCPNCCPDVSGFDAFDGSGRKFLTLTTVYSLSYSNSGDSNCAHGISISANYTIVSTYGPADCGADPCSCDLKCTGVGHSEYVCQQSLGTSTCTSNIVSLCENPDIDECFTWDTTIVQADGTVIHTDVACMQGLGYGILDGIFTVDSATQRHQGATNGATWVQTLSDECL